ncbi:hypothetical protein CR513_08418, partial [Mucuna pruriens]
MDLVQKNLSMSTRNIFQNYEKMNVVFTYKPLELLNLNLFGLTKTLSLVTNMRHSMRLKYSIEELKMKRSGHGIEFENVEFKSLCKNNDIFHNFLFSSRTL